MTSPPGSGESETKRDPGLTVPGLVLGGGPTVLLLHGSADTEGCWRGVMAELAPRVRLVAPSLPRLRGAVAAGSLALNLDLPWLASLIEELEPVAVVGHSYGALLALTAARSGVWSGPLALIEPIAFGLLGDRKAGIDALNTSFFGALDRGEDEVALEGLVEYWNGPGSWGALPDGARDKLRAGLPHTRAEVASGREDATTPQSVAGLGPAVVLVGEHTTAESRAVCEALGGALGEPVNIVEGAGHQAPRTHAHAVAHALGGWLDRFL